MDSKEAGESKMFHITSSTLAAGPIFTTQNSAEITLEMHFKLSLETQFFAFIFKM